MTNDPRQLIDGYLDETLSSDEHELLNRWLKAAPENAQQLAQRRSCTIACEANISRSR